MNPDIGTFVCNHFSLSLYDRKRTPLDVRRKTILIEIDSLTQNELYT